MKRNVKKAIACALVFAMEVVSISQTTEAKIKKPALSKTTLTLKVSQKSTIRVKNVTPKKTSWSLTKAGKKVVSLSEKKKTSVKVKGKKTGIAVLTAKIKVRKKTYKKECRIKVKKASTIQTAKPTNKVTHTKVPTMTPTRVPTDVSKPTATATAPATVTATATPVTLSNPKTESNGIRTWDCINFGTYPQSAYIPKQAPENPVSDTEYTDSDGTKMVYREWKRYDSEKEDYVSRQGYFKIEPIKWRVLSINGNDAFLLADQSLDTKPYNEEEVPVTWETCTLRTWLNSTFLSAAFISAEQAAIKNTTVVNDDNPYMKSEGGNNTTDKVYLLSIAEAINTAYGFNGNFCAYSKTKEATNTAYTKSRGFVLDEHSDACDCWWLRSPGHSYACTAATVNSEYNDGYYVVYNNSSVRPALHLDLSSSTLWSYAGKVIVNGESATPTATPAATPTATPTATPVNIIKVGEGASASAVTVDETATYPITISALNETTFTSEDKRPADADMVTDNLKYNKDGSVSFTSLKEYNSGVSYYINPCTSEDQIEDISDIRGEGFLGYKNGTKDMAAYDYIRIKVTSANQLNIRTYNGNNQLLTAGFPGVSTSELYEGIQMGLAREDIWKEDSIYNAGFTVKSEYETRTIFIPISFLMEKGVSPETLTAIAICPQSAEVDVTIHSIDFVKVNYDTKATAIEVTSNKTEVAPGKTAKVKANFTPADATRQIVKWTSDDEEIATVDFQGTVVAGVKTGEVTITAAATDGSGVTGSVKITVGEASDENEKIVTKKVDLTKVVAKTNLEGPHIAATGTAGIEFLTGGSMTYVDFSQYLEDNKLDLSDYDELRVTWEVQDADGNKVTTYGDDEKAPTYGKIAYTNTDNLNGYDSGIDVNYEGPDDTSANTSWLSEPFTGQTCVLTIAKTNPTELATVGGFNLQLSSLPINMHIVITDITFYKDNNVHMDLTKVVAKANPEGPHIAATGTAAGIEFLTGGSMTYVDFSQYLEDNKLDLSNYDELRVTWEVQDADGNKVTDYADAENKPSWGKICYTDTDKLNGYSDGIDVNYEGPDDTSANTSWLSEPFTGQTCVLTIAKTNPTELATVDGFNLQFSGIPANMKVVITDISLIKN